MKIMIFTLIFGLAYSAYFGFNWKAQSKAEEVCDGIFFIHMIVGAFLFGLEEGFAAGLKVGL